MTYSEESGNFIKGFVLGLGDFAICENPEESEEHAEGEEGVVFQRRLHGGESNANKEVSAPIDKNSHAHGSWTWALGKELRRDHPGNGTRSNGKEDDVEEGGDD